MKKLWIVVGVIVVVALLGGAWWLLMNKVAAPADSSSLPDTSKNTSTNPDTTNTPTTTDAQSGTVMVNMKDTAFTPSTIKIKKGTKVVWTNQDSVRHNVVADSSNAAGLPTSNSDLLGKGEQYTFTFNVAGTVKYHCTPHPFMTGTVEVVE